MMAKLPRSSFFPPAELANEDGIVGAGGELTPEWLLDAYKQGIFPWPVGNNCPTLWWSPDPRAIIQMDDLYVSRRLRRTCLCGRFEVTCDRDFGGVIGGCASSGDRESQTWLTPKMVEAYKRMFELGYAHSVEVWHSGQLVGGVYGLAIGGLFSAESKYHIMRDASKVALVRLVSHLRARGYVLLDIQQLTPHAARFGAIEIPRNEYLMRLAEALNTRVTFGDHLEGTF